MRTTRSLLIVLAALSGTTEAHGEAAGDTRDYTLLEPRSAVAVAKSSSQIAVTWKAPQIADRVAGYRVWLGGEEVGRTQGLTYTHEGLRPGLTYVFRVAACNAKGEIGRPSKIAEATTPSQTGQVLPLTSIGIFERGREVLVTWWTENESTSRAISHEGG